MRSQGLYVNPYYLSSDMVAFIYDETAYLQHAASLTITPPVPTGTSTPLKRAAQHRRSASRLTADMSELSSASPTTIQLRPTEAPITPGSTRHLRPASPPTSTRTPGPPDPHPHEPTPTPTPNPHYLYLSNVQSFLRQTYGAQYAMVNVGPALKHIVPEADEMFYSGEVIEVDDREPPPCATCTDEEECGLPGCPYHKDNPEVPYFRWEFAGYMGTPPLDVLTRMAQEVAHVLEMNSALASAMTRGGRSMGPGTGFPSSSGGTSSSTNTDQKVVAFHTSAGLASAAHSVYFLAACARFMEHRPGIGRPFHSVDEAFRDLVASRPLPPAEGEVELPAEALQLLLPLVAQRGPGWLPLTRADTRTAALPDRTRDHLLPGLTGGSRSGTPGAAAGAGIGVARGHHGSGTLPGPSTAQMRRAWPPMLNAQLQYARMLQNIHPVSPCGTSGIGVVARGGVPGGAKLAMRHFSVLALPLQFTYQRAGGLVPNLSHVHHPTAIQGGDGGAKTPGHRDHATAASTTSGTPTKSGTPMSALSALPDFLTRPFSTSHHPQSSSSG